MSRSAADATRFTATAPHAYSKPGSYRSTAQSARRGAQADSTGRGHGAPPPPNGDGGPPTETAKEKVARLRQAHAARRAAEISKWDHVIIRGRAIADAAHRVTVMGLVGLSVIAGAVTVYSFIDLSRYNRRKQKEWLQTQYENLQKELLEASKAERAGVATSEQMLLLNRERAAEQAKREKENRKGITGYVKDLFSTEGLKKDHSINEEQLVADNAADAISNSIPVAAVPDVTVPRMGTEAEGPVTKALNQHRRQGEKALEAKGMQGGPLDQIASSATDQAKKSAGSWSSWLGSGSK